MASRHLTNLGEAQSSAVPPGDDTLDQAGMQIAIAESLRARDSNQVTQSMNQGSEENNLPVHTSENRVSIDDRINDMTTKAEIELPIVHDSQGDTLIYIDPPQIQPEQDEHEYERYTKRYETPMLMKKDTLTKYSPGLAKLFGPTQQYRFLRRRKLANKLPSNVKYVIDLTPPSEGEGRHLFSSKFPIASRRASNERNALFLTPQDCLIFRIPRYKNHANCEICADAVFLTTELCCSEGVRLWHQSNEIWNVSKTLVKGAEEYSSVSSIPLSRRKTSKLTEWKAPSRLEQVRGGSGAKATSSTILPLEYSPVRHRSAIERVLSALQGNNPALDSAPKVWTTFAVAKNLEITHSPLEDYIIRWLRAYPNSYFLEVLPEVSHQIADGLQNYDLARDSFAVLVGEEALDSLRRAQQPREYTTFGRKKEGLPEHIHTRIEYASKSFLERINSDFADFVVNGMQWIDELPEVHRLSAYKQPELQDTVHKLKDLLRDYVRGSIYRVLCADYETVPGPDIPHDGGHDLLPRVNRTVIWANMPLSERILSRTFWEALMSFTKLKGASNLDLHTGWELKGGPNHLSQCEKRELDRGTYRKIIDSELRALIRNGQSLLDQASIPSPNLHNDQQRLKADPLSTPLQTLPDRTINKMQGQNQQGSLLLAHTGDYDIHNAQRQSDVKPLPKQTYTFPDRTSDVQDIAMNSKAPHSTPAQPINVPKLLKRTQHFPDALSPPKKQYEFEFRSKWPFGAPRDDPIAQVQKSVDGLHFSSIPLNGRPATDRALEQSLGQGPRNEAIPIRADPWLGYSDHLSHANEALQHLAYEGAGFWDRVQQTLVPKTSWNLDKTALGERAVSADSDIWAGYNELNDDGGVQQQTEESRPKKTNLMTNFFGLETFFFQAGSYIDAFAANKLRSSGQLELGIVNTLVCLEDSEWKYLPLYAGGNDDGSMGVYNDDLPTAEHGFTTAGPEVHDGSTPVNSDKAPSEFDLISAGDSASTFNASTATNRGFSDTIRRGHVHAVDSVDDSRSDSFTIVTPSADSDDEETLARKQIEARERIEEAEEAAAYEARRILKGKGKMVDEDESYADLFQSEEEEEEEEEEDDNYTECAETIDEEEYGEDMVMV